jgi:DNA gyrase/topoisomerase IV subunit A
MPVKHFSMSKTEFSVNLSLDDVNLVVIQTQTDKLLYIFTQIGNCYKVDVGDIPECKLRDKGVLLKDIFKDAAMGERPVAVYAVVPETPLEGELVWLTRLGMIKRSTWADGCGVQKSIFQCYKLREDRPDEILRVDEFKEGRTIMLLSQGGYVLNAMTGDVPVQGRVAGGVKGISMPDNEYAVCNCVAKPSGFIVAVTDKGNVKRVEVKTVDKMVRYRKGLQFGGALEAGESVIFGCWVKGDEDLVIQTADGGVHFVPTADIPVTCRADKWKYVAKIGKVKVKACFIHRRKKNN